MKAKVVMTAPVITVTPVSLVRDIAQLLFERRISGVPVLDGNRVAGIVSESDLLHRHEINTDRSNVPVTWWSRFIGRDPLPGWYVKSHGKRARDIMTRHVVSVTEDAPLSRIGDILDTHRIRRVPVLRGGRLVGIVTRADIVRVLCAEGGATDEPHRPTDDEIRSSLLNELERHPWWHRALSVVYVNHGVVCFRGFVNGEAEKRAARVAAENVHGVRGVQDRRSPSAEWNPMM